MRKINSRLLIKLPDGWSMAKESIQLVAPHAIANVIVSSEDAGPVETTEQYAAAHHGTLRTEFDGYHEIAFGPAIILGGHEGYLRHFEWAPPNGVGVTQLQAYLVHDGRAYTATATSPTNNFAAVEPVLRQILEQVIVG
jgi:hypothetical protein